MIVDRHAVLERIENDQELYDEICGIFRDDVKKIMKHLKEASEGGDIPVAARHAHSLVSAAANIGATDLSETARSAENALRSGDPEKIPLLISEIEIKLSYVLEELELFSQGR